MLSELNFGSQGTLLLQFLLVSSLMRVHSGKDREEMMPKTMFITRAKKVGDTKIGGHEAVTITIEGREIFCGRRDEQE